MASRVSRFVQKSLFFLSRVDAVRPYNTSFGISRAELCVRQIQPTAIIFRSSAVKSFMVLALLTSALVSIVCFIATLVMGVTMARGGLSQHVLFGLFTTFLVTLTQSMTMFS